MEHVLRCNSLKCRKTLETRAVVTTCSHIFCVDCSNKLGLTDPQGNIRVCPACNTELPNVDDAVVTQLNPSEDYKTSVLSGLSPSIILECASRALSFYTYQTSQEILYQEYLTRSLAEKFKIMDMDSKQYAAKKDAEVAHVSDRLQAVTLEKEKLERKNHELATAFREKSKKQQELQKLYKALKQQQEMGNGMEEAADMNAENVLQNAAVASHDRANYNHGAPLHSRGEGSNGSGPRVGMPNHRRPHDNYAVAVNRPGLYGTRGAGVPVTPSGHRHALPQGIYGNGISQHTAFPQGTPQGPQRTPLGNLSPNMFGKRQVPHMGGMSAGIKVGRSQGWEYQRDMTSGVRPLVR